MSVVIEYEPYISWRPRAILSADDRFSDEMPSIAPPPQSETRGKMLGLGRSAVLARYVYEGADGGRSWAEGQELRLNRIYLNGG